MQQNPKRRREGSDLTPEPSSVEPSSENPELAKAKARARKAKEAQLAARAPAAMEEVPSEKPGDGDGAASAPLIFPGAVAVPGRRAAVGGPGSAAAAPARQSRGVGPGSASAAAAAAAAPRQPSGVGPGDEDEEEDDDLLGVSRPAAAAAAAPSRQPAAAAAAAAAAAPSRQPAAAAAAAAAAPMDAAPAEAEPSFWDKYLGSDFPPEYRLDAIAALKDLAYLDSIHDFWKERGKKKVTDEDEDEPNDIPEDRLNIVKASLVNTIANYTSFKVSKNPEVSSDENLGMLLKGLTGSLVRSPWGIEDSVLEYFKRKYKPFNEPEGAMTLNDIVTKWRFAEDYGSNWEKYQGAVSALPNTLDIVFDAKVKNIKVLDQKQLGTLGFFLLAFLNPSAGNPGKIPLITFTFDMAPRDIGKIFERFTQVKNGVYPQNVADSATTSFTALQGRTSFFRANYTNSTTEKKQDPVVQPIRSNAYTHEKYTFEFEDTNFNEKNRFAFSIVVKNKAGKEVGRIPFGGRSEQGPSVNYLMNIISTDIATATKVMLDGKVKVADLRSLKVYEPGILFDLKRLGDQEQMLIDNVIGVSGDRFAIALRRILQKPGIYNSTRGIRPSRGINALSEEVMKKQARQFRTNVVMGKLKVISQIISPGGALEMAEKGLAAMKDEIKKGMDTGTVFMDPVKIPGSGLTQDFIDKNYTQIASTVAAYILRKKMMDIYTYITTLEAQVHALIKTVPGLDPAGCTFIPTKLTKPAEPCPPGSLGLPVPPGPAAAVSPEKQKEIDEAIDKAIDAALDPLEAFIAQSEALKKMRVPMYVSWDAATNKMGLPKPEPIYIQLFNENKLLKGVTSNRFNFSAGPFIHPETGLQAVIGRLLRLSQSSRPSTVEKQINALLVDYFRARDAITASLFDDTAGGIKDRLEAMTDIDNGLSAERVVHAGADGKRGLIEVIQGILDEMNPPPSTAAAAAAASAPRQPAAVGGPMADDDEEEEEDEELVESDGAASASAAAAAASAAPLVPASAASAASAAPVAQQYIPGRAGPLGLLAEKAPKQPAVGEPQPPVRKGKLPLPGYKRFAGGGPQVGGDKGDFRQFRDMHDLFAELCLEAGVALELARERAARPAMDESADSAAAPNDLVDALNNIEVRWVLGIDEFRTQSLDDYGSKFEDTYTTSLLLTLLSCRSSSDGKSVDYTTIFKAEDTSVYPNLDTIITKGDETNYNDIMGQVLTQARFPTEQFILETLDTIGKVILSPAAASEKDEGGNPIPASKYSSRAGWGGLPAMIYTVAYKTAKNEQIPSELLGLVRGGGLEGSDDTQSNADNSAPLVPPGGRRGLYARLR